MSDPHDNDTPSIDDGRVRVNLGKYTLSWDPNAPRCGYECDCCLFDDGTAPSAHARDCEVFQPDGAVCDCGASP